MKKNFSKVKENNVKLFYLRGGFDFKKLDLSNKILMALFRVRLSLKSNKSPDEKGMLAAYSKPMDFARRENIKQIIEYTQSIA
jgi:hypothetical protein